MPQTKIPRGDAREDRLQTGRSNNGSIFVGILIAVVNIIATGRVIIVGSESGPMILIGFGKIFAIGNIGVGALN